MRPRFRLLWQMLQSAQVQLVANLDCRGDETWCEITLLGRATTRRIAAMREVCCSRAADLDRPKVHREADSGSPCQYKTDSGRCRAVRKSKHPGEQVACPTGWGLLLQHPRRGGLKAGPSRLRQAGQGRRRAPEARPGPGKGAPGRPPAQ